MIQIIRKALSGIQLREPLKFKNMTVFPVFYKSLNGFQYISLKKAMEKNLVKITEVSKAGLVPLVKVKNLSELPVLILDGEEIQGAKQNRMINATVLIGKYSELDINVSCTEKGRWSYYSRPSTGYSGDDFLFADYASPCFMRRSKNKSVTESLNKNKGYMSDQSRVWDDIEVCIESYDVPTTTSAYRDVYNARKDVFKQFSNSLPLQSGQTGLLVAVNGKICGFDMISLESVFADLYSKLVESYAMDALMREKEQNEETTLVQAKEFLSTMAKCSWNAFDSLGLGKDFRFKGQKKTGTALFYKGCVIHASFFSQESPAEAHEPPDWLR
jgi:hypothetical protein